MLDTTPQLPADDSPTPKNGPFDRAALSVAAVSFSLGRVVATPGALLALEAAEVTPIQLLRRHHGGDWGDLDDEDLAANRAALLTGARLLSAYTLPGTEQKIWIITEADRSSTCLLLPSEY